MKVEISLESCVQRARCRRADANFAYGTHAVHTDPGASPVISVCRLF